MKTKAIVGLIMACLACGGEALAHPERRPADELIGELIVSLMPKSYAPDWSRRWATVGFYAAHARWSLTPPGSGSEQADSLGVYRRYGVLGDAAGRAEVTVCGDREDVRAVTVTTGVGADPEISPALTLSRTVRDVLVREGVTATEISSRPGAAEYGLSAPGREPAALVVTVDCTSRFSRAAQRCVTTHRLVFRASYRDSQRLAAHPAEFCDQRPPWRRNLPAAITPEERREN